MAKNIPQPKGKSSRKTFGETLMIIPSSPVPSRSIPSKKSTLGCSPDPEARGAYYAYYTRTASQTRLVAKLADTQVRRP